jgi:hypothetical protein
VVATTLVSRLLSPNQIAGYRRDLS